MTQEWAIQSRAHHCAVTGEEFQEGDFFYTLLFDETTGFRREDISEAAYKARPADAPEPFSFWRSKYEPPPAAPPEALGKQTAEDLLRHYTQENKPEHRNARYILALMLERKRILKQVDQKTAEDGSSILVYELGKSGEVFLIPDPQLRLDEIEAVQMEVADMLSPR